MSELVTQQVGSTGHIHLNRPGALNALTLDMIVGMRAALRRWAADASVRSVVVTGEGERAFCAGGDIKALWHAGQAGELGPGSFTDTFFREEYQLNYQIATYPKPYVSWLDGLTMGGGVGISILGSHRVASEHMKFAMPETAIGFFPDVGGSYFLSRMGTVGRLLALTGLPIDAEASQSLGIATQFVTHDRGESLVERIGKDGVEEALAELSEAELSEPCGSSDSSGVLVTLAQQCFDTSRIEQIMAALDEASTDSTIGELAQKVRQTLQTRSPTSLRMTLEQLSRGKGLRLNECLAMEFRMSQACLQGHDLYEGIRAVLIDKDHAPAWSPARVADVDDELVARHFVALGADELELP